MRGMRRPSVSRRSMGFRDRSGCVTTHMEFVVWNCSQLVTLAGPARARAGPEMRELTIIRNGAMLIRHGRIVAIGRRGGLEAVGSPSIKIVDAGGRISLPWLVHSHTPPLFPPPHPHRL